MNHSILPKSEKGSNIDIIKRIGTVSNGKKIIYLRKTAEDYLKNKIDLKKN